MFVRFGVQETQSLRDQKVHNDEILKEYYTKMTKLGINILTLH